MQRRRRERDRRRSRRTRRRSARYLRSDLDAQFDGGGRVRRPHPHDARGVAGREPQPPGRRLDVAAVGRRVLGRVGVEHRVRRVPVPHPRPPVRLAERVRDAARHRDARGRAARGAHRRGARASPSRARDTNASSASCSSSAASMRCRRTFATTTRASTAGRRRARSPGAVASRRRGASRRATARASSRPRSTTSTTRDSRTRSLEPETARNVEGGHPLGRDGRRVADGRPRDRLVQQGSTS